MSFPSTTWKKSCYACGKNTFDWEMRHPYYVGRSLIDGPVPLCQDCIIREKDYRSEKD